ncbi:hypothetical protein [Phocaeicola sp.]
MNKKQVLRTLFALAAIALTSAGCSNQEMLPETTGNSTEETNAIVTFQLGLPGGDEVNYNRVATTQDPTESTFKTLIVYDFKSDATTENTTSPLAGIYKINIKTAATNADTPAVGSGECVPTGDGSKYSVKLSLRAKAGDHHQFVFVANDQCTAYDDVATIGTSTLGELLKSISDKEVSTGSTPNTFLGVSGNTSVDQLTDEDKAKAGLAMTGKSPVLTINSDNKSNIVTEPVYMTRLMARIDVKNYVPASRNFKLKSVKMTNAAPKSYLFENWMGSIWNDQKTFVTLEQNPYYKDGYKTYVSGTSNEAWVASITSNEGREGTWYKKVLYAYEYPTTVSGIATATPQLLVEYTLNGSLYTQTVNMVKTAENTTKRFNITRNHVYTLQIGDTGTPGGEVQFTFQINNWTSHEIDADLNGGSDVANN